MQAVLACCIALVAVAVSMGTGPGAISDVEEIGMVGLDGELGKAAHYNAEDVVKLEKAAASDEKEHQPNQVDDDGIPNHYVHLPTGDPRRNKVVSPLPHNVINMLSLPDTFDWRNVDGQSYASVPRNQHIPKYCGACWAFASLSALNDRIKIARKDEWPEIVLSPQHMLSCGSAGSCFGGNHFLAYKWLTQEGNVDETCAPYQAEDHTTERKNAWGETVHDHHCTPERVCKDCAHGGGCHAVQSPKKYSIAEYGEVKGEQNIMAEIKSRGPVACGVAVTDSFMKEYKSGVFEDMTGEKKIRHVVSLLGWGVAEDGTKYWIGRNSWGTYWGENGFFKIIRGKDNLKIESECAWAVPKSNFPTEKQMLGTNDKLTKGLVGSTTHFLKNPTPTAPKDKVMTKQQLKNLLGDPNSPFNH